MTMERACSLADLDATGVVGTEIDNVPVAVVRDEDGDLHAVNNVCSHQYVLLSEGEVDGCTIECWLHGSRFDLRTGQPSGLPATRAIDVYPLRVEGDDVLVDVSAPLTTTPSGADGSATKES
jgi:3-phenylpropionate/trans-cinnamate dioxygenase ferredoxin subunit